MKQRLGPKKVRKIEGYVGGGVLVAWVRGGWPHYWAMVTMQDGRFPVLWVNWVTGEIDVANTKTRVPR